MTDESTVKMERSALSVLSVQSPSISDVCSQSTIISGPAAPRPRGHSRGFGVCSLPEELKTSVMCVED